MASVKISDPGSITTQPTVINKTRLRLNTFTGMFDELVDHLTSIRKGALEGEKEAGTAYSSEYGKVTKIVKDHVSGMSDQDIAFAWTGLNLKLVANSVERSDVSNSIIAAWDKAAAKYLRGNVTDGESAVNDLKSRLAEFELAVTSEGQTPVKEDT